MTEEEEETEEDEERPAKHMHALTDTGRKTQEQEKQGSLRIFTDTCMVLRTGYTAKTDHTKQIH